MASINIAAGTIFDSRGLIPITGLKPKMTYPEIEGVVEKELAKLREEASVAEGIKRRELITQIVRIEIMGETLWIAFDK